MMKSQRQDLILRAVAESGVLSVEQAMVRCHASQATVRRDFNELASDELVERVRGGIRSPSTGGAVPFAVREIQQVTQKLAIAERASHLLSAGDVVFVDGGTTTLQLASCLPDLPLRIITNSLRLAASIENHAMAQSRWEIFLTGGYLFPGSGLLVGPSAQAGLAQYHADWALLSAGGITSDGVFNANEHVVESERVMIGNADRVAILADHTKLGRHAMCHIAGLDDVDVLVTDQSPSESAHLASIAERDVEVLVTDSNLDIENVRNT